MTNTGKVLVIALILLDAGSITYQFYPKGGRSNAAPDPAASRYATTPAADSRFNSAHMTAGNVISTSPVANASGAIAGASVAAGSIPAATNAATEMPPPAQRHKQPVHAREAAESRESVASKTHPPPSVNRARPDLTRQGSNAVAAAMTQALVKESSKPDPSMPMPPPMQRSAPPTQDRHGSNAVAAAMTEQLVRESSRVSPASQSTAPNGAQ